MRTSFVMRFAGVFFLTIGLNSGCAPETAENPATVGGAADASAIAQVEPRPDVYAEFTLTADLSHLSDNQREMVGLLIEASQIMDDLYWRQAYGDDYQEWLASIGVADERRFAELNYGPWDRLDGDKPLMDAVGDKPLGANF